MATKLQNAGPTMIAALDRSVGIFTTRELERLFHASRTDWDLARATKVAEWLEFLQTRGSLRKVTFQPDGHPPFSRYVWGQVSEHRLAASLWKGAYLSHGTAVFLHGLTDDLPKVIHVNREQSRKPAPVGGLTQEALDLAFARRQRTSSYEFTIGDYRVLLLNGKHTGRLEVVQLPEPFDSGMLPVTSLERTLIDIVVRPAYAGGVWHLLAAYEGARDRVRITVLVATLKQLGYVYPYHQAIGFLLERAGVEPARLEPLRAMGLDFDFHLEHGMRERDYHPGWRLFHPKGL